MIAMPVSIRTQMTIAMADQSAPRKKNGRKPKLRMAGPVHARICWAEVVVK